MVLGEAEPQHAAVCRPRELCTAHRERPHRTSPRGRIRDDGDSHAVARLGTDAWNHVERRHEVRVVCVDLGAEAADRFAVGIEPLGVHAQSVHLLWNLETERRAHHEVLVWLVFRGAGREQIGAERCGDEQVRNDTHSRMLYRISRIAKM
ncbi:MAG: hypothetical protein J0I07_38540 [Myxococcales bacterium]|nr:hypothetical protein [Myxococcales bacterium]